MEVIDDAGFVLRRSRDYFLRPVLVPDAGLRKALRSFDMDYVIAGIASIFLFGYLIYALLKPEKF